VNGVSDFCGFRCFDARSLLPTRRDLANGCVVAEILARYFPQDVSLHSFENVSSLPLKDANWHLLLKLFRVSPETIARHRGTCAMSRSHQA